MVTIPWWFVRYGFPALALAGVTATVLLVRPALHDGEAAKARAPARVASLEARRAESPRIRSARVAAYSVRSGDTLAVIAERFGTSVDRLLELNVGIDPRALRVGQSIRVG